MTDKNPLAHYSGVLSQAVQESAGPNVPASGAAALSQYLKDCEQHSVVPDVGGAFAFAFAAGFNLATTQAAPIAWPKDAQDVRDFFRSDFITAQFPAQDQAPCDEDRYVISAHDFLSAVNWWADFPHVPREPQAAPTAVAVPAQALTGEARAEAIKRLAPIRAKLATAAPAQAAPAAVAVPDEREALRSVLSALVRDADSEPDGEYLQGAGKNRVAVHRKGIERARAALAATPAADAPDLHAQIMNLPLGTFGTGIGDIGIAYRAGHRAARHAAAELATFHATQLATFSAAAPVVLPEPRVSVPAHWVKELISLCGPEQHELRDRTLKSLEKVVPVDDRDLVERGEVLVTVSGFTGSGKSAVAGEIEIMCRALGLQVEWLDGESEKNMTHADWTAALEQYKPRIRVVERNVSTGGGE